MMWVGIYAALAVCVVFLSIKLANYVDLIDKKTDLSGAFIGGVILAAVTSLPELFTSISAVLFVKQPDLVMGNILGSNLFNMCIFGGAALIAAKALCKSTIGNSHLKTTVITFVMFAIMLLPVVFKKDYTVVGISVYSIILLVLYACSIKFMAGDSAESEGEDTSDLTLKQIIIRFIIMAVLLVTASIFITIAADHLSEEFNLGKTVGGALFLGVATSLPELTSSIALIRKGNFNACAGNVMGSGVFNFCIISVADILYRGGSVYISNDKSSSYLNIFGLVAAAVVGIILIMKQRKKDTENAGLKLFYRIGGFAILACYGAFLFLSNAK
ncbi:MAG: sodium:calcium antiporter [Clostridia bacterium]|nr:sodium:calcium antiporter [Clostridia bacterium]